MTLLEVLLELDSLFEGCEKMITQPDDPSGIYTEYVLDTEAFREKLQNRIRELSLGQEKKED